MDARRKYLLKELGIDLWVGRAAPAAYNDPPDRVAESADRDYSIAVVAPTREPEMAKPGRPSKAAASAIAVVAPIPTPAPTLPPLEVPQDWAGLREVVKNCTRCKLRPTCTQTVFGVGLETAPLMVVGEGPGADEDAQGEPFVGRAGKLLDEMLRSIGRSRTENVFIANVVKCRPPGNRDPEPDEVEACRPYLDQQIRLVKPKLIVALGRIAAQRLLSTDEPLSKLRGPMYQYGPEKTPLFITYHPAYLLRSPREKAKSWEDLKKVHRYLQGAA